MEQADCLHIFVLMIYMMTIKRAIGLPMDICFTQKDPSPWQKGCLWIRNSGYVINSVTLLTLNVGFELEKQNTYYAYEDYSNNSRNVLNLVLDSYYDYLILPWDNAVGELKTSRMSMPDGISLPKFDYFLETSPSKFINLYRNGIFFYSECVYTDNQSAICVGELDNRNMTGGTMPTIQPIFTNNGNQTATIQSTLTTPGQANLSIVQNYTTNTTLAFSQGNVYSIANVTHLQGQESTVSSGASLETSEVNGPSSVGYLSAYTTQTSKAAHTVSSPNNTFTNVTSSVITPNNIQMNVTNGPVTGSSYPPGSYNTNIYTSAPIKLGQVTTSQLEMMTVVSGSNLNSSSYMVPTYSHGQTQETSNSAKASDNYSANIPTSTPSNPGPNMTSRHETATAITGSGSNSSNPTAQANLNGQTLGTFHNMTAMFTTLDIINVQNLSTGSRESTEGYSVVRSQLTAKPYIMLGNYERVIYSDSIEKIEGVIPWNPPKGCIKCFKSSRLGGYKWNKGVQFLP